MRILSIDPGKKGGWAFYDGHSVIVGEMPMIADDINVHPFIGYFGIEEPLKVYIEKVGSMPRQSCVSTFTFGKGYGQLIGMCQVLGWSYQLVGVHTWKNKILKDTAKDKDAAISVAHRLFPQVNLVPAGRRKVHDGIADALCILQYALLEEKV
jgi:crossover junction endodeoxyribonuclease RuvC